MYSCFKLGCDLNLIKCAIICSETWTLSMLQTSRFCFKQKADTVTHHIASSLKLPIGAACTCPGVAVSLWEDAAWTLLFWLATTMTYWSLLTSSLLPRKCETVYRRWLHSLSLHKLFDKWWAQCWKSWSMCRGKIWDCVWWLLETSRCLCCLQTTWVLPLWYG